MPDQMIVENCSPTLAGIKTGNLFSVHHEKAPQVRQDLRELNSKIRDKGLRAVPVRSSDENTLIYLYRPDFLERDLRKPEVRRILLEKGYPCDSAEQCVAQLGRRLSDSAKPFPHEIGLFLGYPPEDVLGFMKDTRNGVKCVGYWKVYGNRAEAEKTFARFRQCTETCKKELLNGKSIAELSVRVRKARPAQAERTSS